MLTTVSGTATFNTDLKANVELRLVSGKSYSVVFWADKYGLMKADKTPNTDNPAYKYLGMNYVLVAAEKTVIDVKFTCGAGSREIPEMTFASVPVQRNYRTNIYGALITDPVNFNVSIDPEYETPDHDIQLNTTLNETSGEKYTSLQAAIDAADAEDVIRVWETMDEDIVLNKDLTIIGGSDEVTVRAAAAAAPGAKIRTLNVANNVIAAFENLQFFGAKNITNSPTSVLVNNVKDVILYPH